METILLVIGVVVVLLVMRPAPRTEVIYVPLAVEEHSGGVGGLPLLIVAIFVLIALSMLQA